MEYIRDVSSSLVASIVFVCLLAFFSKRAKEIFILVVSRWLSHDLMYVFKDKNEANPDVQKEIEEAAFVLIMTARGNDFQQDTFLPLLDGRHKFVEVKILLPNPYRTEDVDWFQQREMELRKFDSAFGAGVLKKQTITNIEYLKNHIYEQNIQLRLHFFPLIGRIVITDRCLFFTPMQRDSYIRKSKTLKYAYGGDMYRHYHRLFDQIWSSATLPPSNHL